MARTSSAALCSTVNWLSANAVCELLKGETYNWRRPLLALGLRLFDVFNRLTSDERESVLIIDDSPYDRSRSKWVELLARVWDHSTGRFLKGFRMLTICWYRRLEKRRGCARIEHYAAF